MKCCRWLLLLMCIIYAAVLVCRGSVMLRNQLVAGVGMPAAALLGAEAEPPFAAAPPVQEGDAYEFATPVDILGPLGKAQLTCDDDPPVPFWDAIEHKKWGLRKVSRPEGEMQLSVMPSCWGGPQGVHALSTPIVLAPLHCPPRPR